MAFKFRGLLGNTEEEQKAKAWELLNLPTEEGQDPAGRMQMVMELLGYEEDEDLSYYEE